MPPSNKQQNASKTKKHDLELPFAAWATSTVERLRKAAGIGVILASAFAISSLNPKEWISKWIDGSLDHCYFDDLAPQRGYLALVQAIACLILACATPAPKVPKHIQKQESHRRTIAHRSCRRIQACIVLVFFLWTLYYAVTAVRLLFEVPPESAAQPFLTSLSVLTSLVLFWIYVEMGQVTIEPETISPESRPANVAPVQLMGIGLAIVVIGLAWFGFATNVPKLSGAVDTVVASLSGVGLCLVVGRLGSKHLDPGPLTLSLLYFYAVIQLGAGAFETSPAVHLVVTTVALPLKVLLWLVCVWAFTTGIMAEYVYELRVLIERIEKKRKGPYDPDDSDNPDDDSAKSNSIL